jgi:Zn-dependent protease
MTADFETRLQMLPFLLGMFIVTSCVHEAGHAWVAWRLGDRREAIRRKISPFTLRHISPIFTILIPGALLLFGLPMLGGARPVMVRTAIGAPRMGLVAIAGPIGNFLVGGLSIVAVTALIHAGWVSTVFSAVATDKLYYGFLTAIGFSFYLGLFNLIPLPPFDGSRVVAVFLPEAVRNLYYKLTIPVIILLLLVPFIGLGSFESDLARWYGEVLLFGHHRVIELRDWIQQ